MDQVINWTPAKAKRFRKAIARAIETNAQEFQFEGHDFVTSYAVYLAQHLSAVLGAHG